MKLRSDNPIIRLRIRLSLTAVVAAFVLGCQESVEVSPVEVTGVYSLRRVSGTIGMRETPVSGQITLATTGLAERRVSYQIDTAGTVREFIESGAYRLLDSVVELSLHGCDGQAMYVWRAHAELEPEGELRLTYPRPADGTIVEVYQRR